MVRMTFIRALTLTATGLTLGSFATSAAADELFVGTWELNTAKSTCEPVPAPKSHTFTIAGAPEGGVHETIDLVEGDGTKTHIEFTSALDGKYVPVTGSGYADSVSLKKVDPRTFNYALKKGGKRIESGTFKVSKDGKSMHGTLSGKDSDVAWKCHFVSVRK